MDRSCVFFHTHPDDKTLLAGGTMARLAAEGNRVVLAVATAGERGLTGHRSCSTETLGRGADERAADLRRRPRL